MENQLSNPKTMENQMSNPVENQMSNPVENQLSNPKTMENQVSNPKTMKNQLSTPVGFKNHGTGAGGARTNENGKHFESVCDTEPLLYQQADVRIEKHMMDTKLVNSYYLVCRKGSTTTTTPWGSLLDHGVVEITYMKQQALKKYVQTHDMLRDSKLSETQRVEALRTFRRPDECFMVTHLNNNQTVRSLVIIEMKHQNVQGSCFEKLNAAPCIRDWYSAVLGHRFDYIHYHFVVSPFIQQKLLTTSIALNILRYRYNIRVCPMTCYHSILPRLLSLSSSESLFDHPDCV